MADGPVSVPQPRRVEGIHGRQPEEQLLRPQPKWYYKLLTGEVTTDPGQDRMGPYDSSRRRATRWSWPVSATRREDQDDEWNGKK